MHCFTDRRPAMNNFKKINPVPVIFIILSAVGWHFSGMSISFIAGEVLVRLIRDGVLVLALIIPIAAGMGLNFAIVIGAIAAQTGWLVALNYKISGYSGIFTAVITGTIISIIAGWLIGKFLNRVRGKEMISTMLIGFLGTSIYQLVFLALYGTVIKCGNPEILLSRGVGVRNMVDLAPYRNTIDKLWSINPGGINIPLFMIFTVLLFAGLIKYIMHTRLGKKIQAAGHSTESASKIGLNTDRIRITAIIISTVTACFGQIIFLQNIGMMNVYTSHMNTDIFSCAALLAGGATIRDAKIRHAFTGIILFHTLFIVSPQAGQNIFSNAALGEYFRSFVAYGSIAFALFINIRRE